MGGACARSVRAAACVQDAAAVERGPHVVPSHSLLLPLREESAHVLDSTVVVRRTNDSGRGLGRYGLERAFPHLFVLGEGHGHE